MVLLLRSVRRFGGVVACSLALAASCAFAQTSAAIPENATKPLLPSGFSGWIQEGAAKTGAVPADADAANADVLTEYGLKDFSDSVYRRDGGKASVHAMRFADATGAFGAFTFYRKPDMNPAAIGNGGAADAREILFWSGTILIQATFDHPATIEQSAVKALAAALPAAGGRSGVAPSLPGYLPADSLDKSTVRYAIGPTAYTRGRGVLPPESIDFNRDAEAVTAQYSARNGRGTLTLIEYPTPQMAIQSEKTLDALLKGPLPATLQQSNPAALGVRRSGPLVAMTSGNFSSAEAQGLLAQVKYQADVTWNRGSDKSKIEVKNAAEMLIGIAYLTAVLAACAILLAIFLGGGRALWRVLHGKPASSVYEEDFISLNLSGWLPGSPRKLP
jgi:hypothetical protein